MTRRSRSSRCNRMVAIAAALAMSAAACSDADPPPLQPRPSAGPRDQPNVTPEGPEPEIDRLSNDQWRRMQAAGMVRPECPIQSPEALRVVEINHYTFDGGTKRGQLVVNADVARSVARIFSTLYEQRFPIRKMKPVETFDGDTNRSLAADNTSGFNCRRPDQINAPFATSPHANGRAIDVNPRENPWQDLRCQCWIPSPKHKSRTPGPGKILRDGPAWRAFTAEGWIWQNIDVADYMHFDTGYPSRPISDAPRRRDR